MNLPRLIDDRFDVGECVGRGATAVVHRGLDRKSGAEVALKFVVSDPTSSEPVERHLLEVAALTTVQHPGLLAFVAHGEVAGAGAYLATEWVEGVSLEQRLERGPIGDDDVIDLARLVADALAAAHAHGIVHRDVTPANVMIPLVGMAWIKLLDFGSVRMSRERFLTQAGVPFGTPGYMAPEQVRGDETITPAADVFALGCVIYRCLSGQSPFPADSLVGQLVKTVLEDPIDLGSHRGDLDVSLASFVMQMLARDPLDRPTDAAQVAAFFSELESNDREATTLGRSASLMPPPLLEALTRDEQRIVSLVLAGAPSPPDLPWNLEDAQQSARAFGGSLMPLAGGAMVVCLESLESATELAVRAARTALALRAERPSASVGAAMGRAVGEATLSGEVVDRVAALADFSASIGPRIDEALAALLGERFEILRDDLGTEILGERMVAEAKRTMLGKSTSLVGRDEELSALMDAYERCEQERRPVAVYVSGPEGIGKSRLRHAFLLMLTQRTEWPMVWRGRGDVLTGRVPFGLLAPPLRQQAGILPTHSIESARRRLTALCARHAPEAEVDRIAMFLGEMVGISYPEGEVLRAARTDSIVMGDAVRAAWESFVDYASAAAPIVLVLEDLQWGDAPSLDLIDRAMRNLPGRSLFVLGLGRDARVPRFPRPSEDADVSHIALGPLSPEASEQLVREAYPELDATRSASVVARADGNPYVLEELVRACAERRGDEIPDNVLAMAQARVRSFSPEQRYVLRAASVFGRVATLSGIIAIAGDADVGAIKAALAEVVALEVFTLLPASEPTFAFRHATLRETVYASLTDEDRRLGHMLAARWLEASGEPSGQVLGAHFERAGDFERAATYFARSAASALDANDLEGAIADVEAVERCGATGEALGEVLVVGAEASLWKGDLDAVVTFTARAVDLLPLSSRASFSARRFATLVLFTLGDRPKAIKVCKSILAARDIVPVPPELALCAASASLNARLAGEADLGDKLLRLAEVLTDTHFTDHGDIRAQLWSARGVRAMFLGDFARARSAYGFERVERERIGDRRRACSAAINIGFTLFEVGYYQEASVVLGEALATANYMGVPMLLPIAELNLGLAVAMSGALSEGLDLELRAIERLLKQGNRRLLATAHSYVARIHARAGDAAAAEAAAKEACAAADGVPPRRCAALGELALASVALGKLEEAELATREAHVLLAMLGSIDSGEARVRLSLVEVLVAKEDLAEARRTAIETRDWLHERADKISDSDLRRSFLEAVSDHVRITQLGAWAESG